jgi:4'-phosphopantetheinyl transferase
MNRPKLEIWWGAPPTAQAYREESLTDEDRSRAGRRTRAKARCEWAVSRGLIQAARASAAARDEAHGERPGPSQQQMLSHSAGHAIYAVADGTVRLGVDLEQWRRRDVLALAPWCCTEDECAVLADLPEPERSRYFYTLWTIKEAFVKALGLDFPADMRHSGLTGTPARGAGQDTWLAACKLRVAAPGNWHAATWCLDGHWIASLVWEPVRDVPSRVASGVARDTASDTAGDLAGAQLNWRAGPFATAPAVTPWGAWDAADPP